ncbi:hypothetical protein CPC08DRAFT_821776 [Agrocybe pediades]|nr:hypothetical protein CPC08DRAFT_821776 [Agrocybe pediades]
MPSSYHHRPQTPGRHHHCPQTPAHPRSPSRAAHEQYYDAHSHSRFMIRNAPSPAPSSASSATLCDYDDGGYNYAPSTTPTPPSALGLYHAPPRSPHRSLHSTPTSGTQPLGYYSHSPHSQRSSPNKTHYDRIATPHSLGSGRELVEVFEFDQESTPYVPKFPGYNSGKDEYEPYFDLHKRAKEQSLGKPDRRFQWQVVLHQSFYPSEYRDEQGRVIPTSEWVPALCDRVGNDDYQLINLAGYFVGQTQDTPGPVYDNTPENRFRLLQWEKKCNRGVGCNFVITSIGRQVLKDCEKLIREYDPDD